MQMSLETLVMPGEFQDALELVNHLEIAKAQFQSALEASDFATARMMVKTMPDTLDELHIMAIRKSSYDTGLKAATQQGVIVMTTTIIQPIGGGESA